jgi:hypothetical protein
LRFFEETKSMREWALDPRCQVTYSELRRRVKACYREYKTVGESVRQMPASLLEKEKPAEPQDPWGAKFRLLKEKTKKAPTA